MRTVSPVATRKVLGIIILKSLPSGGADVKMLVRWERQMFEVPLKAIVRECNPPVSWHQPRVSGLRPRL